MTKKERETVKWAVQQLMADDGDFHGAVGRLARLCGLRIEAFERSEGKELRQMDFRDFSALPISTFKVSP